VRIWAGGAGQPASLPRKFARGGRADGSDAARTPPATPSPPQSTGGAADGSDAARTPPGAPPAPESTGGGAADGSDAGPVAPGAQAPELAGGVPPVHGAGGPPQGASPQFTRDAARGPRPPPLRRPIPAAVRRHVWLRDGGRCRYRDPLTGRRCNSSHLLQIHHLLPVAEGGGPEPENLALACLAHHRMCHGYRPGPASEPGW
ncbi:MAG: HNH endonuclease, partial [Spirochaetaceae bacterium]|nr:HNH endonuclease [Spirochaetaceae bacterium]